MRYYCGIDLHSDNHYICVIDDDDNRLFEAKQPNDARLLLAVLAPFKKQLKLYIEVAATDEADSPKFDREIDEVYKS